METFERIKCDEDFTLCSILSQLQQRLVAHFQEIHENDYFDDENFLAHCDCQDSQKFINQFINHILSHSIKNEIKIIEEVLEEEKQQFDEEIIYENIIDYQCNNCDISYKTFKAYSRHIEDEHNEENSLLCSYAPCKNRFKDQQKLRTHMNKHEAELSRRDDGFLYCRICGKLCSTKDLLIAHLGTHYQDYSCDYCGKKFSRYQYMKRHVEHHVFKRKIDKKVILCALCPKFIPKDRMKRHIYLSHSNNKDYKCNVCGKNFKQSGSLRDHLDIHQLTPRYSCEYCLKKFYNHSNWKNHLLRHTEPDKFKCEICNQKFVNSKALTQHMKRKHDQVKEKIRCPFEECDKFYYLDVTLKSHIKRVHQQKDSMSQECSLCKFSTSNTKNLQQHMWRIHKQRKHPEFS